MNNELPGLFKRHSGKVCKNIIRDRYLLLLIIPAAIYYIIFCYVPMYGAIIAFKDFSITKGILGSPWVGLKYFQQFFDSIYFFRLLRNTLLLNIYGLLWGFPIPIVFALLANEVHNISIKKIVQSVTYFPYFISVVVIVGMLNLFLQTETGIINILLKEIGINPQNFMGDTKWFRTIYIVSNIWQNFGFSSIIYIGTIAGIDPQLYESAKIDGADRFNQMRHITLPHLVPITIILLIINLGNILNVGFEKIILMYSPATYEAADVISTYAYRAGLVSAKYSFGAAVGLFNSVTNFILIILFNYISKKTTKIKLF